MHQQMNICPKEHEGQQNRQQMPGSSQTHKTTIPLAILTESASTQLLSLFFLLKVKKQQHYFVLFLCILIGEKSSTGTSASSTVPRSPAPKKPHAL